jgi:hypothetical protein
MANVRLIKHEAVPNCGSYEARYADGRPSQFFYWDDLPARRLDPNTLTSEQAFEKAKAAARHARDSLSGRDYRSAWPTPYISSIVLCGPD